MYYPEYDGLVYYHQVLDKDYPKKAAKMVIKKFISGLFAAKGYLIILKLRLRGKIILKIAPSVVM